MRIEGYPEFEPGLGGHTAAMIVFGLLALGALAYCVRLARRERQIWPLAVFGGSMLLVSYEPFNNLLAHCAYPLADQPTMLSYLGQHVPVSTWFIYMFYFSVAVPALMLRLDRGITMRQLWRYYGIAVLTCAAFEPLFANEHLGVRWWFYYGDNQALDFTGMPMFWWFANAMVVCVTAMIFHLVRRHLLTTDRQTLLFIPLEPLILFGIHGSAGIPVFIAVSSADSVLLSTIATLASIGLSLMYMYLFGRAVTVSGETPEPERARAGEPGPAPAPERVPAAV